MRDDLKSIIRRGLGNTEPQTLIKLCIETPAAKPILVNLGQRAILGRADHNGFDVDINLAAYEAAQKGVSRLHASIEVVNMTIMVSDLGSTNGNFPQRAPSNTGTAMRSKRGRSGEARQIAAIRFPCRGKPAKCKLETVRRSMESRDKKENAATPASE